jgi:exodeoxyribonuclease V alpha subunit
VSALSTVNALLQIGALRVVDHALAQSLSRLRPETDEAVLIAAALCSRASAQGHSRLPLAQVAEFLAEITPEQNWPELPPHADWLEALRASPWVTDVLTAGATVGAASAAKNAPASPAPFAAALDSRMAGQAAPTKASAVLILEDDAVSLRRYWAHEMRLAQALRLRVAEAAATLDAETRTHIANAFPAESDAMQARAAEIALGSRLLLLTGGPGTGKTRTVATLLALLDERARRSGYALRVALAAPTGKAAARLAEAVRERAPSLTLPAQTLHRLLGLSGDGRPPRFDAAHPLPFDVVVADEASMVDLPMVARLFDAVPAHALLILVGDPDQLPSVEAGAVLAALCAAGSEASSAHRVHLERIYRQTAMLDLAPLSAAIRAGAGDTSLDLLHHSHGVHWQQGSDQALAAHIRDHAVPHYQRVAGCADLAGALSQAKRFRVLTALRDGPAGSQTLNSLIARHLQPDGAAFFPGRLLLITENSYRHGLFNGDVGLCWPDAEGVLRVWFDNESRSDNAPPTGPRAWHPAQLPAHESAFALTVHKAQGSEFEQVLLALPEHDARVITRELLYTGLTRAREGVLLWAGETLLRAAIARRLLRWDGLAARLS